MESGAVSPLSVVEPVRRARENAVIATVIASSDEAFVKTGQRWIQYPGGEIQTDLSATGLCSQLGYEALGV